jgi:excisionase family DNA binding protein
MSIARSATSVSCGPKDLPRRKQQAREGSELPNLRFNVAEAARILRFSRATRYSRISVGEIRTQKDGRRTYITRAELERYVASRG